MSLRVSGQVKVGGLLIGGGFPPPVQTMWKEPLGRKDLEGDAGKAILDRIHGLGKMGCGLLRFAVPDLEAAEVIGELAQMVSMPLVADIHFDYKIALRCLDFPIAKIRINPGNIGSRDKVEAVISTAARKGVPIRIGINAGSLPKDLQNRVDQGSLATAEAMFLAAERELDIFREFAFKDVLVSMKASGIADTISANRFFAERSDVPLHIGVTEAGPLIAGVVKNAAALINLLSDGIGDTVRVSLSDTMEKEVIAGREIIEAVRDLRALNGGKAAVLPGAQGRGVRIISCPRCGRAGFDTHAFTERWQARLYSIDKSISVAIMGCEVNGPVEARHADLGITGSGNKVLLFRRGKVIRTMEAAEADAAFAEELENILGSFSTGE